MCSNIFQTGCTALFFASQQGHNDIIKLLFEFGASTDLQTKVFCLPGANLNAAKALTFSEGKKTVNKSF